MGGAVFVVDGGSLTLSGDGILGGSAVTGGPPGGLAGGGDPTAGAAYGSGMFLQGASGTLAFAPGRGATFTIADDIADEAGSNGTASTNARGMTVDGDGGTVVVTGAETYSGATTVAGSVLEIDGSLALSGVDVSGGTLQGIGSVAALDAESGTVAPGTASEPFGALHVTGDATFGGSSTLSLKADASSTSIAMLAVDGTATLGGTVAVDFGDASPAVGSLYTVLTAGSIGGSFAVSLPDGVFGQLVYAADSVTLQITDSAPDSIFEDGFDGGALR
jgi:autotransporter-associated beta strand protein